MDLFHCIFGSFVLECQFCFAEGTPDNILPLRLMTGKISKGIFCKGDIWRLRRNWPFKYSLLILASKKVICYDVTNERLVCRKLDCKLQLFLSDSGPIIFLHCPKLTHSLRTSWRCQLLFYADIDVDVDGDVDAEVCSKYISLFLVEAVKLKFI